MITALVSTLATLGAILLYRQFVLPHEIERAIDEFDKPGTLTPAPGSSGDVIVSLLAVTGEAQRELLSLVRSLAITAAGAEEMAKLTAHLDERPRVKDLPLDQPSFFPEETESGANYRQSHLAEALAHIETPDGGKLTDV